MAAEAERAMRHEAEGRSSSAKADSERRAASFKSAVHAATAQVQAELDQLRACHAGHVRARICYYHQPADLTCIAAVAHCEQRLGSGCELRALPYLAMCYKHLPLADARG